MKPFASVSARPGTLTALLFAMCLLLGLLPAWASETGPQIGLINQAIQKTLGYSSNLQAAKDDLDSAYFARSESQTGFLPSP